MPLSWNLPWEKKALKHDDITNRIKLQFTLNVFIYYYSEILIPLAYVRINILYKLCFVEK